VSRRFREYLTENQTFLTRRNGLNIRLLDRLRAVPGDYVPLSELGPNLQQVRGDLTSLVSFGFGIEQHPYRGASYVGPAERLCPDQIEHELATRWLGRRIVVWNRVTSTNDLALRAGDSRSNNGLVILAEEQTSGRGRQGRSWTAPPRSSILMSVLLFPPPHLTPGDSTARSDQTWLTALGAIATADVVSSWIGQSARIKWPNDVRVRGRKIGGILVERWLAPNSVPASSQSFSKPAWGVVIGIGLNANLPCEGFPPELAVRSTSLQIERGGARIDRSELARDLIRRLDHWYDLSRTDGPESLNAAWCQRSEHLGCLVTVSTPCTHVVGRLVDLDVRVGVTLELSSIGSDASQDAAVQPPSGLFGHDLSLDQRSDRTFTLKCSSSALEDQLPRMAKLPLADVRSIDALHENHAARVIDPDSRNIGSGTARRAVLD
jgi:BirA family transcriptional regulator, biotin operon repressor / biotin---[acetyl-CoA-carboxylase] ligase